MRLCALWPVFILGLLGIATAQGKVSLYPINGTVSPPSDDGSSPLISLQQCFIYFGRQKCQLYVNQNGHLTFERPWGRYIPLRFPMHGPKDIIAPFWTDLDNRKIGNVLFNQNTWGPVLQQATRDINKYFPIYNFVASWVFVATWDRVAYYPNVGDGSTIQVVIISDGELSFLLMNYETTYPTNNKVQVRHLCAVCYQAGYDTVDSTEYFSIPGSFSPKATGSDSTLRMNSNVNVPGCWAFRIDKGERGKIIEPAYPDVFWTDSTCTTKCNYDGSDLSCDNESCAFSQVCNPLNDLHFTCQSVQKGICTISGDPHYTTFDGKRHHFQGACTYVLSEQCGSDLPHYRVEGSNEHRGSKATWTRLVKIFVYNQTIELVKGHGGEAKVDGVFTTTPFFLANGDVHVYTSGPSVVVSTAFGLVVSYDAYHYVKIKVPYSYQGATCGLCGNFNNDSNDDFQTPEGQIVSAFDFGNSWQVPSADEPECEAVCEGLDCGQCPEDKEALFRNTDHCGILQDTSGPFAACHSVLSPAAYVEDCLYDLCLEGGQQRILCLALNVYASECQEKGVQLPRWRTAGFCEIHCPPNSHFESQGTACPATCVNPESPHDCELTPIESCICDGGFVLSGADCVPLHECGCSFEGRYYHSGQTVILDQDCGRVCDCISGNMTCHSHSCGAHEQCKVVDGERGCYSHTCSISGVSIQLGVSFWTDRTCTNKCTCTTSGLSCVNGACAHSQVCNPLNDLHFTCQSVQKGICTISGDPHYTTFDGKRHHFQGACTYVLSEQCGSDLPHYRVEGSNEHRGSKAAWTRLVKIFVYNQTIELVKGHGGEAKVDGVFTTTPFFLANGDVHVYTSGPSVVVSTAFGLVVSYDAYHYVKIKVPYSYQGATCGLCGNFNNDSNDDFQTPEGQIVSAFDFGNSWQVPSADEPECEAVCEGLDCGQCPEDKEALFRNTDHCGILQDTSGPFAACHSVLSPAAYVEDCLYDLCLEGGQQRILCLALNVYASECQEKGVQLPRWRTAGFCEIHCPPNSHFESQGTACPATCVNPESPHDCELTPIESCICDEGFVLSGADCVPLHECGCSFEGRYYHSGQTVILDQDCGRVCDCISGNMTCHSHSCGAHEQCKVVDGERGCYSHTCSISVCNPLNDLHFTCQSVQKGICTISGDPHYTTFDGKRHHFQGACTYVLSEQCGSDLPHYRVEGSNEHRGSKAAWTRLGMVVKLRFAFTHLTVSSRIRFSYVIGLLLQVDGVFTTTPFFLANGDVHVYTSGPSVVVSTAFGLVVSYDANHYVKIKVPYSYQGATCGLCGNFNNDSNDDFQTPEGQIVSAFDFGNSWQVPSADEPECEAVCEGLDCGQCPEDKEALFRNTDHCGILQDTSGPFAACHSVLSPAAYVEDCLYDLCLEGGQQRILCQALNVYASECQEKGVQLPRWRTAGFCEIHCPPNSHFESQGTACPATCVNPESPHDCELTPIESCICDEGFVLSGADCVPLHECGCSFEGRYYHSGQTVILDQDCGRVCDCISGNMTCHSHSCGAHEQCKSVQKGICTISGDPHYTTFDGKRHHFQGACTYVLSEQCGSDLPHYRVEGSNEHRGSKATWTRLVKIFVYNQTIELVKGHGGEAKVDGVFTTTPFFLANGDVHVYTSGPSVVVSTAFGLVVSYDANHYVKIKVPYSYQGVTCGLCGNFNNDSNDDFQTPEGQIVSAFDFGNSWQVPSADEPECEAVCEGLDCGQCPEDKEALFRNTDHCGILQDTSGPFAACHSVLSPAAYVEDCLYDLCLEGGQQRILCLALNVYASECQEKGVQLPRWRTAGFCEIHCPPNSHFESQGTACPATCVNPESPHDCELTPIESCICDGGFVLSVVEHMNSARWWMEKEDATVTHAPSQVILPA
ncbi:IgGFc-binding protein-like [Eucyclogobius newberryi]|uniref:IgGFc-binding protein-like n=1 Tax=Eucyclogobius newberryi TaxID=166745 RepID=UPI003B5A0091